VAPFPLRELPTTLGEWHVPGDREEPLDPAVVAVLGCTDYVRRTYVDDRTGVAAEVLILYGPATVAHHPEVCYPGAGYRLVAGPEPRSFDTGAGPGTFAALTFAQGEGGTADLQQVLYALRYGPEGWTTVNDFRRITRAPGVYKVQLTRPVSPRERLDLGNPSEDLLRALLPELERRIAAAGGGDGPASASRSVPR
jgi:hypothetical protein